MQELRLNRKNWTKVSLGDVVFEPKETAKNIIEEGFEHIVGLEHIGSDDIRLRKSFSSDTKTTFTKIFRKGDVLFGRRRAYLKKAAQAIFDGVCSGDITVLRAKDNLDIQLLPFIIHNEKFFDYAVKHSAGGLSPRVKFKDLANYQFLLPTKEQQAKIAELLWALDDVIEKYLKVLARLEDYKKSKGLELQGNLEEKVKLTKIAKLIMGQSPDGNSYNQDGDGIPFIQGNAEFTSDGPINKLYTTEPSKFAEENDILISVRAPVGDLNIANKQFCIGRGLAAIRLNNPKLIGYVFEYLKNSKHILESKSSGSTFKSINKDVLSGLDIYISNDESKIEEVLEFYFKVNNSLQVLESKIQSSKSLQRSLINQVFKTL